jgi:ribosomal-protein-alanine N-acetyltransferase
MADSVSITDRPIVCCLDGQRDDMFLAAWEPSSDGRRGAVLVAPVVGRPHDLIAAIRAIGDRPAILVLDEGAERHRAVLADALPSIVIVSPEIPLAAVAARTAVDRPDLARPPHALRPTYIRRPDAELARERQQQKNAAIITGLAESSDLAAVDELQRRSFTNAWGAEAIRWELEHTDVARLYVARSGDRTVIAYCACWMVFDELHINSLAVDEPWRRKGVARQLLADVFRESIAAGARSATLEVRQSNTAARMLYEGLGFRVEAVRRDYYQAPREDALILWNRNLRAPRP